MPLPHGHRIDAPSRVAICGAGCAGLSAAVELAEKIPGIDLTVFDAAHTPDTSKTWCSWAVRPHRFDDAVSDTWTRVRVRGGRHDTTIDAGRYPYSCIHASDFVGRALERLQDRATLRWGSAVESISEDRSGVSLNLRAAGGQVRSESFDLVLDGRTPSKESLQGHRSEPTLLQHFGGIRVRVPEGRIDTSVATLMDFEVDQGSGAHFMYVLPMRDGTVLVESTLLTPPGFEPVDYESHATAYLDRELGVVSPEVVYRESGVLPMTLAALGQAATSRVWPIGTRAGVGRASSGYAFDAIQRDTSRVAAALLGGRPRPRVPRSPLLSMLDRVLISWLAADPAAAPEVFGGLFARCPPESLIRFLADEPTAGDLVRTMWAMPKLRTAAHATMSRAAWPRPRAAAVRERASLA
ncbi:MAG: lycopene cyclase family protein [Planctomycetota bacterium]